MSTIPVDGVLEPVLRRFGNAVAALADPVPIWEHGACRWSDAVYQRLRAALVGKTGAGRRRAVPSSRMPCRTDVLVWLLEVDAAVAEWTPDGKGDTVDRLHTLTARGWRPQDCGLIDGYCELIEKWVLGAAELLGDRAPAVALRLPCPACGQQFTYRRSGGGESVRSWALRVSETGCECLGCRAFWGPDQFEFLARLLGCPALPS